MDLVQSAFLRSLGWSLVDSVWQMGILWVLYLGITSNGKRFDASKRHSLALLSITGGSAWFLGELVYNLFNPGGIAFTAQRETLIYHFSRLNPGLDSILPILSIIYLVVCLVLFIRLIRQYQTTKKLSVQGLQKIRPELKLFANHHASHLNIKRKIQIWLSANIDSPLTIGFWKPMILLPLAAINQLSIEQAEAIILHELNHIRRNDYLVNLVVAFSTVVLFFNPFARLLAMILKNEREHCCDDLVIQFQYKPGHYAEALLLLEKSRGISNQVQLQATGTNRFHLFQRVRRILTGEPATTPVSHRMLAVFISFLFIGFIGWYRPSQQLNEALIPSLADGFVRMETNGDILFKENKQPDFPGKNEILFKVIAPVDLTKSRMTPATVKQKSEDKTAELDPVFYESSVHDDDDATETNTNFATNSSNREFSIYAPPVEPLPITSSDASHPYVPASTLDFTFIDDTTVPKAVISNLEEVKAKEAMEKAMVALDEIDWLKLQKELGITGDKMNIVSLQNELKKAVCDLNWKKICTELDQSQNELDEQNLSNSELQKELEHYQEVQKKQQKLNEARQQMIIDRLILNEARTEKNRKIISL